MSGSFVNWVQMILLVACGLVHLIFWQQVPRSWPVVPFSGHLGASGRWSGTGVWFGGSAINPVRPFLGASEWRLASSYVSRQPASQLREAGDPTKLREQAFDWNNFQSDEKSSLFDLKW